MPSLFGLIGCGAAGPFSSEGFFAPAFESGGLGAPQPVVQKISPAKNPKPGGFFFAMGRFLPKLYPLRLELTSACHEHDLKTIKKTENRASNRSKSCFCGDFSEFSRDFAG